MLARERYEQIETQILSPYAALARGSRGREVPEPACPYRTVYQRDRDRILHSKSFRRLKHKTQVFLSPEGDHYRTRLTHTLEVSQIARTIARALQLNEDLTEAISLGHDLGHTPFGHAGERALDRVMEGGFRHYEQSVRVVEQLENDGRGLNLTYEVRNGIDRHTNGEWSDTLEGRVVRLSDRIAYINHDMDDAIRAEVLKETDVPASVREVLGESRATRIDTLVAAVVESSGAEIKMDPRIETYFSQLHAFMFEALYRNPVAKSEEGKVDGVVSSLFTHFCEHPQTLPEEYAAIRERDGTPRAVCDFIAGMTDNYALEIYHRVFIPRGWAMKQ